MPSTRPATRRLAVRCPDRCLRPVCRDARTGQRQEFVALLTRVQTAFANADAAGWRHVGRPRASSSVPAARAADGREGIEKLFQEAFAAHKQAKLLLHVQRFRMVNDSLALVDAVAEVKPAVATGGTPLASFVIVKHDGRWMIESAREVICHMPPQTNHLKDLQWLAGRMGQRHVARRHHDAHDLRLDGQPGVS